MKLKLYTYLSVSTKENSKIWSFGMWFIDIFVVEILWNTKNNLKKANFRVFYENQNGKNLFEILPADDTTIEDCYWHWLVVALYYIYFYNPKLNILISRCVPNCM